MATQPQPEQTVILANGGRQCVDYRKFRQRIGAWPHSYAAEMLHGWMPVSPSEDAARQVNQALSGNAALRGPLLADYVAASHEHLTARASAWRRIVAANGMPGAGERGRRRAFLLGASAGFAVMTGSVATGRMGPVLIGGVAGLGGMTVAGAEALEAHAILRSIEGLDRCLADEYRRQTGGALPLFSSLRRAHSR